MKRKWWLPVGAAMAAVLLSLCFFGVRLRLAPRLVLSRALGSSLEQLEDRFEDSPVHLIANALDLKGFQKADLQLETELEPFGVVRFDMLLHTQLAPKRIQAEGTLVTAGKALDLSVYLDGNFAAVSSRSLVEGSYYGITYDSFSKDIRSRQFLAALIGEKKISGWEDSVSALDQVMSRDEKLPEWKLKDIVSALYGVLSLKPQIGLADTPADGATKTYTVQFQASGQEISELMEPYRVKMRPELLKVIDIWAEDPAADIQVTFFLQRGALVQIQVAAESSAGDTRISAMLGNHPETDPLTVTVAARTGEDYTDTTLKIDTVSDDISYQEKLALSRTENGVQRNFSANYTYDLSSREMDLTILRNGDKADLRLNLAGEDDSLTVRSQNVASFLNLFLKKPLERPAICTLTLSPGSEVTMPEYRNLDQWSTDDLFSLLGGLGGLLGLNLP